MAKTEINLLPLQVQRQRAYRALLRGLGQFIRRVYLSLGVLAVALALILAAVLSIQDIVLDRDDESTAGQPLEESALGINNLTTYMETRIKGYDVWSGRTAEVMRLLPAEVNLISIMMKKDSGRVEITGMADQRAAIKTFRDGLGALGWVIEVESPLQNFALGETAQWSFTLITKADEIVP